MECHSDKPVAQGAIRLPPFKLAVPHPRAATPMPSPVQPTVVYIVAPGPAARAVRAALMTMNVLPREATGNAAGMRGLQAQLLANPDWLAIVDLHALLPRSVGNPLALVALLSDNAIRAQVVLARGNSGPVWHVDRTWVRRLGFCDLVADLDSAALLGEAAVVLEHVATHTGAGLVSAPKLRQYFSAMQVRPDSDGVRGVIRGLTQQTAEKVCQALASGVASADRVHNVTSYPACFVASQAVDWLCRHYRLPRLQAVVLGQALQSLGLLSHVVHEQVFADAMLFFRANTLAEDGQLAPDAVLKKLNAANGVVVRDRSYRVRNYPACFVGSEAVDVLQGAFGLPRHVCEMVLNRLHGYGLIEHVTLDHPVRDGNFFYRFTSVASKALT